MSEEKKTCDNDNKAEEIAKAVAIILREILRVIFKKKGKCEWLCVHSHLCWRHRVIHVNLSLFMYFTKD